MNHEPLRAVTNEEVRQYREDGIVLLRGLFDSRWVEHLRPLVDEDMRAPGPLHLELEKNRGSEDRSRFFFDTFLATSGVPTMESRTKAQVASSSTPSSGIASRASRDSCANPPRAPSPAG